MTFDLTTEFAETWSEKEDRIKRKEKRFFSFPHDLFKRKDF